jgi:hypothetical protein
MGRRSTSILAGLIGLLVASVAAALGLTGRWQMDFGTNRPLAGEHFMLASGSL